MHSARGAVPKKTPSHPSAPLIPYLVDVLEQKNNIPLDVHASMPSPRTMPRRNEQGLGRTPTLLCLYVRIVFPLT